MKISVFQCQSKDRFTFILMKIKPNVYIIVVGIVISDGVLLIVVGNGHGDSSSNPGRE